VHFKPVIIDDMGLKAPPKHSGEYLLEVIMRRYEKPVHHHDQQPASGGMGQTPGATCQPPARSWIVFPAPRPDYRHYRAELPAQRPRHHRRKRGQNKKIKSKSNDPGCAGGFAEARRSTAEATR
jgi:hypothetical protein